MPEKDSLADPPRVPWLHVAAVALVLTALNAIKPAHIDDPAYLLYGNEFAAHPLNPYAFRVASLNDLPANEFLVPPVLPYWLSIGIRLFGDSLTPLKFWLLPFAVLFAWSTAFLATRFAPSLRAPIVWLGVLSPAVLPSFNVMLEVPVLALGLTALAVAMRAVERDSWALLLLAGVIAGLAIQTKYTGLVSCAAIFFWCALRGRATRGVVAVAVAMTLAVGWECWLVQVQGESHFLVALRQRQGKSLSRMIHLALPLVTQVAGLTAAVTVLGLRALGWKPRAALAVGVLFTGGFVLLALVPSQVGLIETENGKRVLTLSNIIYGLMAILAWVTFARLCLCLLKRESGASDSDRTINRFLLFWLILELGGYYALSPYPAARRVVGPVFVLALVAARVAHLRAVPARAVWGAAAFGATLALVFFGVDALDARAEREAAHTVARGSHRPAEGGTYWHLSWWGFGYYSDREGLLPLQTNRQVPRPGDLIAVQDQAELIEAMKQQKQLVLEQIGTVAVSDYVPLCLVPGYYDGRTPIEHLSRDRFRVMIYRVVAVNARPPN